LFQIVDFVGTQIFFRVLIKTGFWLDAQVVHKHGETPHFIKGRMMGIEGI
jgi:hypothetical protein